MMSHSDELLKYFREQREENSLLVSEGIEKYRKGDASFALEGLPDGTAVHVEQKKHRFRFGINLFMLDEFETEEKNAEYRRKLPEIFNLCTLPFYWCDTEPEEGVYRYKKGSRRIYRRPPVDLCLEYCLQNGIEPKLHCLNYDIQAPDWVKGRPVQEVKALLERRFADIARRYADVIPCLEVTNETLQISHKTSFFNEDDFVEWSFLTADRYFPHNRLMINDYNVWDPTGAHTRNYYYMQIERLLRTVSHFDAVGMQFHCFFPPEEEERHAAERYNPRKLRALMDLFARFGKAEQITEMTIPGRPDDEETQAELLTELYRVFFSHPAMEAIIYWNLPDGYAYNSAPGDMTAGEAQYRGGLLRYDLSEKPAYRAIRDLINREWHTSLDTAVRDGKVDFRGFYGDYDLSFVRDGRMVTKTVRF